MVYYRITNAGKQAQVRGQWQVTALRAGTGKALACVHVGRETGGMRARASLRETLREA